MYISQDIDIILDLMHRISSNFNILNKRIVCLQEEAASFDDIETIYDSMEFRVSVLEKDNDELDTRLKKIRVKIMVISKNYAPLSEIDEIVELMDMGLVEISKELKSVVNSLSTLKLQLNKK